MDRLVWLHAPLLLGGDGVPAVNALGLDALAEAPGFDLLSSETVGPDLLSTYRLSWRADGTQVKAAGESAGALLA